MSPTAGTLAVALTAALTLLVGAYGLRLARSTSDFYVASRTVSPAWNASAIGGEYLSAASFLGIAGLILAVGADMLWFAVGYTAGYLVLLVAVAAPLRRSGAYTVPDFAEARLESARVRQVCSALVVTIGWLYLLPQFQAAGLVVRTVTGAPTWVGPALVGVVVVASVAFGGMRSITLVQACQYWLKLTALGVPLIFVLIVWRGVGAPGPSATGSLDRDWLLPMSSGEPGALYSTLALLVALLFGTMGLPHVVVRFYTNPDGRAARRTTVTVLALLGAFYLLPTVYGVLGRLYTPELVAAGRADTVVLELPSAVVGGTLGQLLSALVTAGAFAAFLSTCSGLTVAVAGVLSQNLLRRRRVHRRVRPATAFRAATIVATAVPLLLSFTAPPLGVADTVGLAFAVAASSFCPLLLLGIWWRGLTDVGAVAGLLVGGLSCTAAVVATIAAGPLPGWPGILLAQPAAWSVPLAFAVMVGASLATPGRIARDVDRTMVRLHTPEDVVLDRGDWDPERRWS